MAWCQQCSSKLWWSFGTLSADLYSTGGCGRITTLGQLPWSRRILNRGGAVQKKWSCEVVGSQLLSVFSTWSSSVLGKTEDALSWVLNIDLICHGQWHTSQVRCQPPCSGSFAYYKKPSWSYQIALVPLLKLYWHGAKNVFPSCGGPSAHLGADLYSTGGCGRITTLGQVPWSKMVLQKDCAVQKCQAAKF